MSEEMGTSGRNEATRPAGVAVIVLMGVAGSGKTTIGERLSRTLGWTFRDADSFHPPVNVAKMSSGTPLSDEDRAPWLAAIAAWIDERRAEGSCGIVSCSALKRTYRDVLLCGRADVRLVYLKGERHLIAERMAGRRNHFMPTALLDSQFATLEEPAPEERAVVVSVAMGKRLLVERVCIALGLAVGADSPTAR